MTATDPHVYDPLGELGDGLPAPGTDEGWAALAAEASRWGYSDPQAYVAAYSGGHINPGAAGWQPGNPHTGFGQVQAYGQAASAAGLPVDQYTAMHTPEALAEARGEGGPPPDAEPDDLAALREEAADHGFASVEEYVRDCTENGYNTGIGGAIGAGSGHDAYERFAQDARDAGRSPGDFLAEKQDNPPEVDRGGTEHPFSPPANFTGDGIPVEYGPDGVSIVPNVGVILPEGVDHYDRYTGEPLDAQGHVVPGVPNAGDGHEFTTALDQRIGLDEHGRIDPAEIDRLETEAREHGDATVSDLVASTTGPFPGHPLSDTGEYARPVVLPGQPPIAYSGPDGSFIIAGDGTVLTAEPGRELSYEGEHGSALVGADGGVITTDEDGHITVTEPQVRYEPEIWTDGPIDAGPVDDFPAPDGTSDSGNVLDVGDLGPVYDDFPTLVDTDGDGLVDAVVPRDGGPDGGLDDGDWVTNEYRYPDDAPAGPDAPGVVDVPAPRQADSGSGDFGQGDPGSDEAPDPRVATTADDLRPGSDDGDADDTPAGAYDEDPLPTSESGSEPVDHQDSGHGESSDSGSHESDDPSSDQAADLEPA